MGIYFKLIEDISEDDMFPMWLENDDTIIVNLCSPRWKITELFEEILSLGLLHETLHIVDPTLTDEQIDYATKIVYKYLKYPG
mgnify:CR=1 FL=1